MNFLVLLENRGGKSNFVPGKMFSDIKKCFLRVMLNSRG